MTTREFYNQIASLENIPAELVEFAADAVAKMDVQNAARKVKAAEKAAETQAAKQPIRDALFEVLGDAENPKTASMLIADAGLEDTVKPASVPSLMRPFVDAGSVLKVDMKVPGKGTQRGYVRA